MSRICHRNESCCASSFAKVTDSCSRISLLFDSRAKPWQSDEHRLMVSNIRCLALGPAPPHGEKAAGCIPHRISEQAFVCCSFWYFCSSAAASSLLVASTERGKASNVSGLTMVKSTAISRPLSQLRSKMSACRWPVPDTASRMCGIAAEDNRYDHVSRRALWRRVMPLCLQLVK